MRSTSGENPWPKGSPPNNWGSGARDSSGAEIAGVCNQAALAAVRRAVTAELASDGRGAAKVLILPADLEEALKEMLGEGGQ